MRTNLAYIDEAATTALERERDTPTIPAAMQKNAQQAGVQVIAGFTLLDPSAVDTALDSATRYRRSKVIDYLKHRGEVAAKFELLGIQPLAILPKGAWERICSESGLYRLSPGHGGKIPVEGSKQLETFEIRATWLSVAFWVGILAGFAGIMAYIGWNIPSPENEHLEGTLVMGLVSPAAVAILFGMLVMGMMKDCAPYIAVYNRLVRLQMKRYNATPHAQLLQDFFPGGTSPAESELQATLVLPTPPQEVAATLLKAKSLSLKVAAVGEAIAFAETPAHIFQKELVRREEVRKAKWAELLRLDPIIYHEHESAVAVIAQFGDFPVEQRVVDMVVNSEYLL